MPIKYLSINNYFSRFLLWALFSLSLRNFRRFFGFFSRFLFFLLYYLFSVYFLRNISQRRNSNLLHVRTFSELCQEPDLHDIVINQSFSNVSRISFLCSLLPACAVNSLNDFFTLRNFSLELLYPFTNVSGFWSADLVLEIFKTIWVLDGRPCLPWIIFLLICTKDEIVKSTTIIRLFHDLTDDHLLPGDPTWNFISINNWFLHLSKLHKDLRKHA